MRIQPVDIKTIAIVARYINQRLVEYGGTAIEHMPYAVNEFHHYLYRENPEFTLAMIDEQPPTTGHPVADAWLAGLAEHLARKHDLKPPAWVEQERYFLPRPAHFGGVNFQRYALIDTPTAWRRRLVFSGPTNF